MREKERERESTRARTANSSCWVCLEADDEEEEEDDDDDKNGNYVLLGIGPSASAAIQKRALGYGERRSSCYRIETTFAVIITASLNDVGKRFKGHLMTFKGPPDFHTDTAKTQKYCKPVHTITEPYYRLPNVLR